MEQVFKGRASLAALHGCHHQTSMHSSSSSSFLLIARSALSHQLVALRSSNATAFSSRLIPAAPGLRRHSSRLLHVSVPVSASAVDDMLGGHHSHIVDAIIHDHKEIKTYYQQYKSSASAEDKQKWSNQWRWEVARHSIGEELVAYPAMEKYVPGGLAMADKDRAQHRVVKENLAELEKMKPGHDPSFDTLMQQTQQTLDQHIKEEEEHDLVKLRESLPGNEGQRLASKFQRTKKLVPTHSHPSAPDKPPFETVVGLLAAPIDKLRDMFEKFPSEEELKQVKPN